MDHLERYIQIDKRPAWEKNYRGSMGSGGNSGLHSVMQELSNQRSKIDEILQKSRNKPYSSQQQIPARLNDDYSEDQYHPPPPPPQEQPLPSYTSTHSLQVQHLPVKSRTNHSIDLDSEHTINDLRRRIDTMKTKKKIIIDHRGPKFHVNNYPRRTDDGEEQVPHLLPSSAMLQLGGPDFSFYDNPAAAAATAAARAQDNNMKQPVENITYRTHTRVLPSLAVKQYITFPAIPLPNQPIDPSRDQTTSPNPLGGDRESRYRRANSTSSSIPADRKPKHHSYSISLAATDLHDLSETASFAGMFDSPRTIPVNNKPSNRSLSLQHHHLRLSKRDRLLLREQQKNTQVMQRIYLNSNHSPQPKRGNYPTPQDSFRLPRIDAPPKERPQPPSINSSGSSSSRGRKNKRTSRSIINPSIVSSLSNSFAPPIDPTNPNIDDFSYFDSSTKTNSRRGSFTNNQHQQQPPHQQNLPPPSPIRFFSYQNDFESLIERQNEETMNILDYVFQSSKDQPKQLLLATLSEFKAHFALHAEKHDKEIRDLKHYHHHFLNFDFPAQFFTTTDE